MRGTVAPANTSARPIGLAYLREHFELHVPEPAVRSEAIDGARSSHEFDGRYVERYPRRFEPDSLNGHLRFALKHEPIDLHVLRRALERIGPDPIVNWVRNQPSGGYARRAWYLYESLTGETLPLNDVAIGNYVDLADDQLQVVGTSAPSQRHRVRDNLLGTPLYAPLIRLTPRLRDWMKAPLQLKAAQMVEGIDPALLARASQYLYTRETKSSYAIEREEAPRNFMERFVRLLSSAGEFAMTKANLVRLQNAIVDPRYAESDWRTTQNYVGETRADYEEVVHYMCPKPEDVPELMNSWQVSCEWLDRCHPVVAAAAASFGFVLIHPFGDGNGRIHRFLIHAILAERGFTPDNLVFPVSSVMLRHRRDYERVFDLHAEPMMPFIDHIVYGPGRAEVLNVTTDLYRFPDLTRFTEYLFACIDETIERDLAEELGFLTRFDQARISIREVVDIPDGRLRLLVQLLNQNHGLLSKNKRSQFPELTDKEIEQIEDAIAHLFGGAADQGLLDLTS